MKKTILSLLCFAGATQLQAQTIVPFDYLKATPNTQMRTLEWETVSGSNGYGHAFYNGLGSNSNGTLSFLKIGARHNTSGYYDMMTFTSDGRVGIGTGTPRAGLTVLADEDDTYIGLGWNSRAALRICNWHAASSGSRAELQFGLNDDPLTNFGVISGVYIGVNGPGTDFAGDLTFGTNPFGSNVIEWMRLTHDGNLLTKDWQGNVNFKVDQWGFVTCRDVLVTAAQIFPDYVFDKNYELKSLDKLKEFITEHKHLPNFESADYYEKHGMNTSEMLIKHQEKIEELTLYIIELKAELDEFKSKVNKPIGQ